MRGIAEERGIDPVRGAKLRRSLGGIRSGVSLPVDFAQAGEREAVGCDNGPTLERRVDGAEEEQLVLDDRTAAFDARIAVLRRHCVYRTIDRLVLLPVRLEAARL